MAKILILRFLKFCFGRPPHVKHVKAAGAAKISVLKGKGDGKILNTLHIVNKFILPF